MANIFLISKRRLGTLMAYISMGSVILFIFNFASGVLWWLWPMTNWVISQNDARLWAWVTVIIMISCIVVFIITWVRGWKTVTANAGNTLGILNDIWVKTKDFTQMKIYEFKNNEWNGFEGVLDDLETIGGVSRARIMNCFNDEVIGLIERGKFDSKSFKKTGRKIADGIAKDIKQSNIYTTDPLLLAKELRASLKQNQVSALDALVSDDKSYKALLELLDKQRDKIPSVDVCKAITAYTENVKNLSLLMVLAEYIFAQDKLGVLKSAEIYIRGMVEGMDDEMSGFRNNVAIAIEKYYKGDGE